MKNKLVDLNNHLFAQLEKLSDEELTGDALKEEIERSKAVSVISSQIIQNGKLALQAMEYGKRELPTFLEDKDGK